MKKHGDWKIPYNKVEIPPELRAAGFSPLLTAILVRRGFVRIADIEKFLSPDAGLLEDPMALADIPAAVTRIRRAIQGDEKVAVYGDYDVDGVTAACLIAGYLRSAGLNCDIYIPDRIEEGYGLNKSAIEALHSRGVSLIITVDCGVTAAEEVRFASALGVDMIITDHHECRGPLPEAVAVINPKRPGGEKCLDLAGVGVAFKLVCALAGDPARVLDEYSDLVTVGTIADVMPVTGENRCLIRAGLKKIRENPQPGIRALLKEAGVADKRITSSTVGYTVSPRINAAGRLGKADVAVGLLMAGSRPEAEKYAALLSGLNRDRQQLEQEICAEALKMLGSGERKTPIVLAAENWHQGVIGIAASRIAEEFSVPAVVICLDGGQGKGSCRSAFDFNLYMALDACSAQLISFGGHAQAAGLRIEADRVDDFRSALGEYYLQNPPSRSLALDIDLRIDDPSLLSMECVESLSLLEPYGSGNPSPLFCITGAVLESVTAIGGGRHLKLYVSKFGRRYECVFFSHEERELAAAAGDYVDIAFCPQINEFQSRKSVQLVITDLKKCDFSRLLDRLKSGEIPPEEAASILPNRGEFARIWRGMEALGGSVSGSPANVSRRVGARMPPGKLYICLMIFAELKLISIEFEHESWIIVQNAPAEKASLSDSDILRRITDIAKPRS